MNYKPDELMHYGTPHIGRTPHSGRYKYGTGEKWESVDDPYIERNNFLDANQALMDKGVKEKERAEYFGLSVNDYRRKKSIALAEERAANITRARRLRDHGVTLEKIGIMIGGEEHPLSEGTIRGWLKASDDSRKSKIDNTVEVLEAKLKKGQMIDVGIGSNLELGITSTTLGTALKALQDKGYVIDTIQVEQPNSKGKYTTIKYAAPQGTTKKDAWINRDKITTITEYSPNEGASYQQTQPPASISSDKVYVVYRDEKGPDGYTGIERDGLIGIRKGVPEVTLGNSKYAQVRIAVDGKYYAKGMAIYDDNVPKGYDIIVYSNKRTMFSDKANGVEGALKELKSDPDNPFGANIKAGAGGQSYYKDSNGSFVKDGDIFVKATKNDTGDRYSLSAVNKIKGDDDWESYRKNLPAQFLSKQPLSLIQRQLDLTYKDKVATLEEIKTLDNPVVRQKMLNDFAGSVDKTARHLDAAALPRQSSKVLIPIPSMKGDEEGQGEIYAPGFKNGTKLALIRYPHSGIFEIPVLTVNNNQPEAKKLLGNAVDAVGINGKVASKLSGADFDGDVAVVVPLSDKVKIESSKSLPGLKGFDPSEAYPKYPGMKVISAKEKQKQMGIVTNLITDMSVQIDLSDPVGAAEMARAVRHSMVIIDAEKHELNYKQSYKDNGIEALKQKYQANPNKARGYGGTTTILSKLGNATISVDEVINAKVDKDGNVVYKDGKPVKAYTADPNTGEYNLVKTGRTYQKMVMDKKQVVDPETGKVKTKKVPRLDADGNPIYKTVKKKTTVSPLDMVKDANDLVSAARSPQELAYANYINKMRALANEARKEALNTETQKRDPVAAKTYAEEVDSLNSRLNIALKNKPLERQAQIRASVKIDRLKKTDPELFEDDKKDKLKKTKAKILTESRKEVGSGKQQIKITDKEWEAIQARAVSNSTLKQILDNCDMETVKKLATPKDTKINVTPAKQARMKALSASGFTLAEIAEYCDCSPSTVSKYLKE